MGKPDPHRGYYLRPAGRTTVPRRIVVIGVADRVEPSMAAPGESVYSLRCGHAALTGETHRGRPCESSIDFIDPGEFWGWLASNVSSKVSTHVYAHDMSRVFRLINGQAACHAGLLVLAHGMQRIDPDSHNDGKARYKSSLYQAYDEIPFMVSGLIHGQRIHLRDALNFWPRPLVDIASWLGMPAPTSPGDDAPDQSVLSYCRDQVQVILAALDRFRSYWTDNDLGPFGRTMTGCARAIYRKHYMGKRPFIVRHALGDGLARDGYYGGRVEAFRIGRHKGPIYKLDQTWAYAHAMYRTRVPYSIHRVAVSPALDVLRRDVERFGILARVCVRTDEALYPKRTKRELYAPDGCRNDRAWQPSEGDHGHLTFAVGEYETVLCGPELELALRRDEVVSCDLACFYHMAELFTQLVEWAWAERTAAEQGCDPFIVQSLKHLMVCFYGSWAMRSTGWETLPGLRQGIGEGGGTWQNLDTGERIQYRSLGDHWQRKVYRGDGISAFPAIAAWITAYQRSEMRRLADIARLENIYAQVVDALYVNEQGYRQLEAAGEIRPGILGGLKIDKVLSDLTVWGCNDLEMSGQAYVAGISSRALPDRPGVFTVRNRQGLSEALANDTADRIVYNSTVRHMSRRYQKGIHDANGYWHPLVLWEYGVGGNVE